jgi:hypothetical protein
VAGTAAVQDEERAAGVEVPELEDDVDGWVSCALLEYILLAALFFKILEGN